MNKWVAELEERKAYTIYGKFHKLYNAKRHDVIRAPLTWKVYPETSAEDFITIGSADAVITGFSVSELMNNNINTNGEIKSPTIDDLWKAINKCKADIAQLTKQE